MYWDNPFRLTGSTDASAYSSPGSGSIGGAGVGFADLWADNKSNVISPTAARSSAPTGTPRAALLQHHEAGRPAPPLHAELFDQGDRVRSCDLRRHRREQAAGAQRRQQGQRHQPVGAGRRPPGQERRPDLPLPDVRLRQLFQAHRVPGLRPVPRGVGRDRPHHGALRLHQDRPGHRARLERRKGDTAGPVVQPPELGPHVPRDQILGRGRPQADVRHPSEQHIQPAGQLRAR